MEVARDGTEDVTRAKFNGSAPFEASTDTIREEDDTAFIYSINPIYKNRREFDSVTN